MNFYSPSMYVFFIYINKLCFSLLSLPGCVIDPLRALKLPR